MSRKIFKPWHRLISALYRRIIGRTDQLEEQLAMYTLTDIIEGFERFAYEILIWVLLIPKTVITIILNPAWVPDYITQELNDKTDDRFDSFLSPVILILVSTLVPVAYLASVPFPGATISGPLEAYVHQPTRFVADASLVEQTQKYRYTWTADEQSLLIYNDPDLADYAIFTWDKPGTKNVHVKVDNGNGEVRESDFKVQIFDENAQLTASIDDGYYTTNRGAGGDFIDSLQTPRGLLIMFLFLTLPMLFALGIDRLRGVPFSRSSFMHSFYIQCYFFSPVILGFWALLLGFTYFLDMNKNPYLLLWPLVVVLILFAWLFVNETRLVMREKKLNLLLALLYTSVCFVLMSVLGYTYFQFTKNPDLVRQSLWIIYTLAIVGILGVAIIRPLIRLVKKLF